MRFLLLFVLLFPALCIQASAPQGLTLFAQLYGRVRYFYPHPDLQKVDWNRFVSESVDTFQKQGFQNVTPNIVEGQFRQWGFDVSIYHTPKVTNSDKSLLPEDKKFWYYRGHGTEVIPGRGLFLSLYKVFGPYGTHYLKPKYMEFSDSCSVSFGNGFWEVKINDSTWLSMPYQPSKLPKGIFTKKKKTPKLYADSTQKYADVIVLWNTLYHFYPYPIPTTWDEMLEKGLALAASPASRDFTIRKYLTNLPDGHCRVYTDAQIKDYGMAPFRWDLVDERLIITDYDTAIIKQNWIGWEVIGINGVPTAKAIAQQRELVTGATLAYRDVDMLHVMRMGAKGDTLRLDLLSPDGNTTQQFSLKLGAKTSQGINPWSRLKAPLPPSICYIDLTTLSYKEFKKRLEGLTCESVIFEMRGYPNFGFGNLITWLAKDSVQYPLFGTRNLNAPSPECGKTFTDTVWFKPEPHVLKSKRIVFLTNASAISAAETFLTTVKYGKLGTIIGSTTAGSNGNITMLRLPGYMISFTGMETLNPDGSPFHGVGVVPDIEVKATVQGLKAGRDEVLEYAVGYLMKAK